MLAAAVIYPAVATDRLEVPVAATAGAAVFFFVVGLVFRWPGVAMFGIAVAGAEYAVYLGFRGGAIDGWAPLVAAGLFLAAELGFRAIEPSGAAAERDVVVRSALWLGGGVLGTAVVGALLLVAAGGATAGLWLAAVGVAAAVVAVAVIVGVAAGSGSR